MRENMRLAVEEGQEFVLGAAADGAGESLAFGVHHCVQRLGGRAELLELQVEERTYAKHLLSQIMTES